MTDFHKNHMMQPSPDTSCQMQMVQAVKSGRTAAQVRRYLKSQGFSGDEIARAADELSTHKSERTE